MMAISFIFCGLKRKEGIPIDSESLHDGQKQKTEITSQHPLKLCPP
jgi:hypothetical protein